MEEKYFDSYACLPLKLLSIFISIKHENLFPKNNIQSNDCHCPVYCLNNSSLTEEFKKDFMSRVLCLYNNK